MKVRYQNGEVSSVRNDLGRELVRAGIAFAVNQKELDEPEQVGPPRTYKPGSVAAPKWKVGQFSKPVSGGFELRIQMQILGQTYSYNGDPYKANARVEWDGGSRYLNGFGRAVPDEILDEYSRQWKANPDLRGLSPIYGTDAVKAFSAESNKRATAQKEFFDKQVAGGSVPYTPSNVLVTPQD
jgi:hypothetical protein